jgi:4-hydroxy-3-methylbut-2-enyl diphosphate reductase
MKLIIASTAGFCMGVRRAVEMALDSPSQHPAPIFTYGPLIHNPQVLKLFADKGVTVLEKIPKQGKGTVIIRAHGVPPAAKQQLKQAGFTVIDATCPRVVKVQSIIKSHNRKGYATIIIGDADHPEVVSLLGFAGDKGYVANSLKQLQGLPEYKKAVVVAQTTQNQGLFQQIGEWVAENRPNYHVYDTICDSTEKRQDEVQRIAQFVDAVIVVGGKNSGNTRRLAEIAKLTGKPAYHVETEEELNLEELTKMKTIGITAGASTPTWVIKGVIRAVEKMPYQRWLGWYTWARQFMRFLLLTNLYVALGAGCLSYAMMCLLDLSTQKSALAVAILYVLSMHALNHLTGRQEDKYNEPDREKFYTRFKSGLTVMALGAGAIGLMAAFRMGSVPFWTLLAMSLLGLSYNIRFLPVSVFPHLKFRRIHDLPGSKTFLIALAWGIVTTGVPFLAAGQAITVKFLIAIIWATCFVFARTAFFDILDMQGDRIVGKATLPLLLGTKQTFKLLKLLLVLLVFLLPIAGLTGLMPSLAFPLTLCPLLLLYIIVAHEKDNRLPGVRMAVAVESLFLLAGLITFFFRMVSIL